MEQQVVGCPLPAAVVEEMEWIRNWFAIPFSNSMSVSIMERADYVNCCRRPRMKKWIVESPDSAANWSRRARGARRGANTDFAFRANWFEAWPVPPYNASNFHGVNCAAVVNREPVNLVRAQPGIEGVFFEVFPARRVESFWLDLNCRSFPRNSQRV
jgi:hypothetical protein